MNERWQVRLEQRDCVPVVLVGALDQFGFHNGRLADNHEKSAVWRKGLDLARVKCLNRTSNSNGVKFAGG